MTNKEPIALRSGVNRLWGAFIWSFIAFLLLYVFGWILSAAEFDEGCRHGVVSGGGQLLEIGTSDFPPETWCRFEQGTVSSAPAWSAPALYVSLALTGVFGVWVLLAEIGRHLDRRD